MKRVRKPSAPVVAAVVVAEAMAVVVVAEAVAAIVADVVAAADEAVIAAATRGDRRQPLVNFRLVIE